MVGLSVLLVVVCQCLTLVTSPPPPPHHEPVHVDDFVETYRQYGVTYEYIYHGMHEVLIMKAGSDLCYYVPLSADNQHKHHYEINHDDQKSHLKHDLAHDSHEQQVELAKRAPPATAPTPEPTPEPRPERALEPHRQPERRHGEHEPAGPYEFHSHKWTFKASTLDHVRDQFQDRLADYYCMDRTIFVIVWGGH